ncbi:MAG: MerR family transcriptional regulator [Alphaproteobacteria bacterium]|nr:MerR family transcriptional regulator [Alphaproteobacteria bacterium]
MRTFSISELAEEFGITARTIRFYEAEELIAPQRRGQTRIYSPRDRARLILILRGKRVGFSLAEIKEMLDLYDMEGGRAVQLAHALKKFDERINSLEQQRADIEHSLTELREARAKMEILLGGLSEDTSTGVEARPRLVGYGLTPDHRD